MAHMHSVYDADTHFIINSATRAIENISDKSVLMQRDHNSEIFTFELPRYVDGHDMSMCNRVEVHFVNTDSVTKEKNRDERRLNDLQLSPDSEDVVVCSWLLDEDVTKYAGSLSFMLRFACMADDEETTDFAWHTAPYENFSVQKNLCKKYDKEITRVIVRGSTPKHSFGIPFDTSSVTGVIIIYAQNNNEVLRKKTADCTITDYDVSVMLAQEDTMLFSADSTAKVQLVIHSHGKAFVSNAIEMNVQDVLSEDVAE